MHMFIFVILMGVVTAHARHGKKIDTDHEKNTISVRMIHGNKADEAEFPYMVYIQTTSTVVNKDWGFEEEIRGFCGGSLINEQFILTAAHCISENWDSDIHVTLGSNDKYARGKYAVKMVSNETFIHPNFTLDNVQNDIGLLKLPRRVNYNDEIQPVNIDTSAYDLHKYDNATGVVSGWGDSQQFPWQEQPRNLLYAHYKVISNEECINTFNASYLTDDKLCVTSPTNQSICFGDSGSPLVVNTNSKRVQIAIADDIFGDNCHENHPQVLVRVSSFIDFIRDVLAANGYEL